MRDVTAKKLTDGLQRTGAFEFKSDDQNELRQKRAEAQRVASSESKQTAANKTQAQNKARLRKQNAVLLPLLTTLFGGKHFCDPNEAAAALRSSLSAPAIRKLLGMGDTPKDKIVANLRGLWLALQPGKHGGRPTTEQRKVKAIVSQAIVGRDEDDADLRAMATLVTPDKDPHGTSLHPKLVRRRVARTRDVLKQAQEERQKESWPAGKGHFNTLKTTRSDAIPSHVIKIMWDVLEAETVVCPDKRLVVQNVRDPRDGSIGPHARHWQFKRDAALLLLVLRSITPFVLSLSRMRLERRKMKFIKKGDFRSCLCVYCYVLKLLLSAAKGRHTSKLIMRNVSCRDAHRNCQCTQNRHARKQARTQPAVESTSEAGAADMESAGAGTSDAESTDVPRHQEITDSSAEEQESDSASEQSGIDSDSDASTDEEHDAVCLNGPNASVAADARDLPLPSTDDDIIMRIHAINGPALPAPVRTPPAPCIQQLLLRTKTCGEFIRNLMCKNPSAACQLRECPDCGHLPAIKLERDFHLRHQIFVEEEVPPSKGHGETYIPPGQKRKKTRKRRVSTMEPFMGNFGTNPQPRDRPWLTPWFTDAKLGRMNAPDLASIVRVHGLSAQGCKQQNLTLARQVMVHRQQHPWQQTVVAKNAAAAKARETAATAAAQAQLASTGIMESLEKCFAEACKCCMEKHAALGHREHGHLDHALYPLHPLGLSNRTAVASRDGGVVTWARITRTEVLPTHPGQVFYHINGADDFAKILPEAAALGAALLGDCLHRNAFGGDAGGQFLKDKHDRWAMQYAAQVARRRLASEEWVEQHMTEYLEREDPDEGMALIGHILGPETDRARWGPNEEPEKLARYQALNQVAMKALTKHWGQRNSSILFGGSDGMGTITGLSLPMCAAPLTAARNLLLRAWRTRMSGGTAVSTIEFGQDSFGESLGAVYPDVIGAPSIESISKQQPQNNVLLEGGAQFDALLKAAQVCNNTTHGGLSEILGFYKALIGNEEVWKCSQFHLLRQWTGSCAFFDWHSDMQDWPDSFRLLVTITVSLGNSQGVFRSGVALPNQEEFWYRDGSGMPLARAFSPLLIHKSAPPPGGIAGNDSELKLVCFVNLAGLRNAAVRRTYVDGFCKRFKKLKAVGATVAVNPAAATASKPVQAQSATSFMERLEKASGAYFRHYLMKKWDVHAEERMASNIQAGGLYNILMMDRDHAENARIRADEHIQQEYETAYRNAQQTHKHSTCTKHTPTAHSTKHTALTCLLLAAHCLPLAACRSLVARRSLLAACCLPLAACRSLLAARCLPLAACRSLLAACCSPLTARRSPLAFRRFCRFCRFCHAACCLLLNAALRSTHTRTHAPTHSPTHPPTHPPTRPPTGTL